MAISAPDPQGQAYAYVAAGSKGLLVVDITDPTRPQEVGSYNPRGWFVEVVVSAPDPQGHTYAYVADYTGGLQVVDVSDPANPWKVGEYDTPGYARDVAISARDPQGNIYAHVAYYHEYIRWYVDYYGNKYGETVYGESGLRMVDVSNPISPTEVSAYDSPGTARGVIVSGTYSYLADGASGLRVVKFDPSEVSPVEEAMACDDLDRCTTVTLTDTTRSAANFAVRTEQEEPPVDAIILDASPLLRYTDPITITGLAAALDYLRALTVTVSSNKTPLYTQNWASGTVT